MDDHNGVQVTFGNRGAMDLESGAGLTGDIL